MEKFSEFYRKYVSGKTSKVIVKNMSDTSDETSDDGSWKDYWLKHSAKDWPKKCSVVGCVERAEHGAHVSCVSPKDDGVYILPLCAKHNNPSFHDSMEIESQDLLVKVVKE